MSQQNLAMAVDRNAHYEQYRRPTNRDLFLATMGQVVPWSDLCELVEPNYPKAVNGRPPVGLVHMLRMYFLQHWFNLADVAYEGAHTLVCRQLQLMASVLGCRQAIAVSHRLD